MHPIAPGTDALRFAVTPPRQRTAVTGAKDDPQQDLRTRVGQFVSGTFFGMMLREMRKTVPDDGLMSGGRGEEIFREFFDRELSDRFAESENFGLVEAAIRQLSGKTVYRKKMLHREGDPQMLPEASTAMAPTKTREANTDGGES